MEQDVLESANQRETCATFTQSDGTVLHRQGRVTSLQTRQRWEYCSGVLGQDVSVEITPPPLLSDAAALPESKQRFLDVLLAAGHFVWRSGPAFCRTQITRAICHREDLCHFPSDRRHFRMFQHVKKTKNKTILLNLIPNFGCKKCKISAFEPSRGKQWQVN